MIDLDTEIEIDRFVIFFEVRLPGFAGKFSESKKYK